MANPRVEEIIDEPESNNKADDAESSSGSEVEAGEGGEGTFSIFSDDM